MDAVKNSHGISMLNGANILKEHVPTFDLYWVWLRDYSSYVKIFDEYHWIIMPMILPTCDVFGQRPIHFERTHLCAIPKRSPFESKTWQWRRGKIQEIMTTVGKIESFVDTKENWETYVERVEQFFLANDIDDDHKVPTLLSLMGGKTYTLLRDLLAPNKPATKSFQQIVTTLQEHLSPKPLEIGERFRF